MGRREDTERAIRFDCGYMASGIFDDEVDVGIDDSWRLHTLRDRGREGPRISRAPHHTRREAVSRSEKHREDICSWNINFWSFGTGAPLYS